ncbi:MAG: 2-oxoacid:ferredoxin oxidoreductase subunit beta, partial [Bacteroidota bacterium]
DKWKAGILTRFFEDNNIESQLPRPFGVLYQEERPVYEELLIEQIDNAKAKERSLDDLLRGDNTWEVS